MVLIFFVRFPRCYFVAYSFRPLAGIMVLIKTVLPLLQQIRAYSFRPLAGIMVLIDEEQSEVINRLFRFRPLAGIMVLIQYR